MVRVKVVGDIRLAARPRLESLKLALRLAHVAVEVVEVTQSASLGPRIRVGGIESLVVLDEDEDAVFASCVDQREVV